MTFTRVNIFRWLLHRECDALVKQAYRWGRGWEREYHRAMDQLEDRKA